MASDPSERPRGRRRFRLPGSHLVHRIAATMFLSLVAIEIVIFIPSYVEKERNLLSEVEGRARSAVMAIASVSDRDLADVIVERGEGLIEDTPIRGIVLYDTNDRVLAVSGEAVEMVPARYLPLDRRVSSRNADGTRFEVLWMPQDLDGSFRIAARLDSSAVFAQLRDYTIRIAELVLLIAAVVTVVLTAVLRKLILTPVLSAHRALLGAGADFSRAHEWTIPGRADGEVGELIAAVNQILLHLSQSFRLINRRSDELMAEAEARRRAEEDARLAHTRMQEAIEAFPGGFAVFDREDRMVLCNEHFKEYYPDHKEVLVPGVKFEELLRVGVSADRARGDLRRDADWIETRLEEHWSGNSDIERRMSSGRWIRITERLTQEGGVLGVFMDISELKRREEALRLSEAKFRSVAESVNDALVVTNVNGEVVFWNKAAERLTGYSATDMLGGSMAPIVLSDRLAVFRQRLDLIRSGRGNELVGKLFETEILTKTDERVPVEVSFSIGSNGNTQYITRALRDIRDRRKIAEERQKLQAQLFQAQKNEALGTLAGGIAHDFNNLLAIILGNARLLEENVPQGATGREELDAIIGAGDRARNVVKQILSFARPDSGGFGPVNLRNVTDETLSLLRATLPASTAVTSRLAENAPVWGDSTQMHQIIMNLCLNARDAIGEEQGSITVELSDAIRESAWPISPFAADPTKKVDEQVLLGRNGESNCLWMGIPPDGDHTCLTVADTGSGMDRETLERIFDPFFTTKDIGKGTGLGLAAVRGIVISHGGAIRVESTPGRGTRVDIHLPPHEAITSGRAVEAAAEERLGGRILVIDDDPEFVSLLRKSLERRGYEADGAGDAGDALRRIGEAPYRWDAVITDIGMPDISGTEVARAVHAIRPDLPIVLCAGTLDPISQDDLSRNPGQAIIAKPVQEAELDRLIQSFLRNGITGGKTDGKNSDNR